MMTLHELLRACRAGEVIPLLIRPLDDPHDPGAMLVLVPNADEQVFYKAVKNYLPILGILVALHTIYVCMDPPTHRASWFQHSYFPFGCIPTCGICRVVHEEATRRLRERGM
jgi:hypothetical protein